MCVAQIVRDLRESVLVRLQFVCYTCPLARVPVALPLAEELAPEELAKGFDVFNVTNEFIF